MHLITLSEILYRFVWREGFGGNRLRSGNMCEAVNIFIFCLLFRCLLWYLESQRLACGTPEILQRAKIYSAELKYCITDSRNT